MKVSEHVANLSELDQSAEIWFVQGREDQLIYMVSFLPDNTTKVCMVLPTAIDKRKIEPQEKQ
jgi:hypothetical protein